MINQTEVSWILIAGVADGVVAGCLFWLIRRPDRDLTQRANTTTQAP